MNKKTSASFISLGCFKNTVDSEVLAGMLEKNNIKIVSSYEKSDWLIINTCGFIREAKEESIDEILLALEKKERGEIKHVAIVGCLTQRYYKDLINTFPNADIVWGVNDFPELARLIALNRKDKYHDRKLFLYTEKNQRIITTGLNSTFIKISEGCDMPCSFCAIPQIRGSYRSRNIISLIKEAENYKKMGFEEINLISQNSTYFGKESGSESKLPELLKELSILGFKWIRILYLMPEEVNDKIIRAFNHPAVLPYFDLPFQHVASGILKKMKRGGGTKRNLELIDKIRKHFENAVIRSTFIAGFPGESETDFEELARFAKNSGIERIGVFGYSPEEKTKAFLLKNRVIPEVIEDRKRIIMDISDHNLQLYNNLILNSIQEFIPLGPWENYSTIGRIASQAPEVDGLTQVKETYDEADKIYPIKITGFKNELLFGEKI